MTRTLFKLSREPTASETAYFIQHIHDYPGVSRFRLEKDTLLVETEPGVARVQIIGWIIALLAVLGIVVYYSQEIMAAIPWDLILALGLIGFSVYLLIYTRGKI